VTIFLMAALDEGKSISGVKDRRCIGAIIQKMLEWEHRPVTDIASSEARLVNGGLRS
jgi:hypothetical protein